MGTNQNQQMQDMMNQLILPKRKVEREVPVKQLVRFLADDFADELIKKQIKKRLS